jgi:hypothetical protein
MPEQIPITIQNPNELLNLLSQGYGTLSRTLMEYVDNAFDSADDFFDEEEQRYSRDVDIEVNLDRNKGRIIISDNCVGMNKDILKRLANEVNNSNKKDKNRSWVNGQFGLGAHAYRLFAKNLTVTSKQKGENGVKIYIERSSSEAALFDNYSTSEIKSESGTIVEIGNIDKIELRNLTIDQLKTDIETHFEMLLKRNVSITITDGTKKVKCEPFDYDQIEGISIIKTISAWENRGIKTTVSSEKSIVLNLKVCKESKNRSVYFTSRGRRIANVLDLKSFKNYVNANNPERRSIWSNILLIGYIDVKDNLSPVIHRNDFERTNLRTAIYAEIIKFSEEIFDAIQKEMQNKNDDGMKALGTALTDILSKLAREDSMNLRKIGEIGSEQLKIPQNTMFDFDDNGDEIFIELGGDNNSSDAIIDPGGRTIQTQGTSNPEGLRSGMPSKPRKRGIKIDFMSIPSEERATYRDNVIYIFTDHPDFQNRVKKTHGGELASLRITARLANYLAAIISSKYKEQFYQQKKLEPERDKVLDEQIDFIFRFENLMQPFIDQRLDKIGDIA